MGYMAYYVALFYFLIAQIVMKSEDRRFKFSSDFVQRNDIMPVRGRTLRSTYPSGRIAKFFLFSPGENESRQILDVHDRESLSNFNPDLGTMMIIHGFLDSVSIAPWMHDMKDELLIYGDYNVIVVDWSSGNSIPYSRAAANTEKVGQEISELLKILLDDYGAKPETFHLIGHSMGSHIAGFVGENVKGIGRITGEGADIEIESTLKDYTGGTTDSQGGLDPAGPRFENEDASRRLDPSDALFVDVIHTDAGGIGMVEATGHQDFYPNGGREQPGCTASNTIRALIQEGVIEGISVSSLEDLILQIRIVRTRCVRNLICSHMRAVLLFTASINNRNCDMVGITCNSWEEFEHGKCVGCATSGERCAIMGFHADLQRVGRNNFRTYYLLTEPEEPFCTHEYRITFEVERNGNSGGGRLLGLRITDLPVIGDKTLKLSVHGSHGTTEFEIDDDRFDSSSKLVTYVVPSKTYLGVIDTVVAEWKQRKSARVITAVTGRKITAPSVEKIEISLVKSSTESRSLESYVLCSAETTSGPEEKSTFRSSYC